MKNLLFLSIYLMIAVSCAPTSSEKDRIPQNYHHYYGGGHDNIPFDQLTPNPIKILSIDGGRWLIQMELLCALEETVGKKIADIFDIFVATSSGGIIAAALATPKNDNSTRSAK